MNKLMNVVLWILQALLAAVFLWHGQLMVAPPAEFVDIMNAQMGVGLRLFIGVAEILAAFGLILPAATRILPKLTVWAGVGLMIVMVSATVLHIFRGEYSSAVFAAVLLLLVTFVTYMRWKVNPIAPRTARGKIELA